MLTRIDQLAMQHWLGKPDGALAVGSRMAGQTARLHTYLCLVVGCSGRRYLLIVLVGHSDALKGGFEIGDLHGADAENAVSTNERK
jgi:hypothetical protein